MNTESLTDGLRETLALFPPSGVPRTTNEVADSLDLGRRSTYDRLERLVERGRLETKKVGASGRVWWRPPATASEPPDWPAVAESLIDDVIDDVEVGVFVLDENFHVAWINEATERYFGLDSTQALGRDKRELIDDHIRAVVDDSAQFVETVLATYDDNTYTERFACHVTAGDDREERWLEHRSKPIEAGAYAGGRVELYYDVTESEHSERVRQEEHAKFDSLVEAVDEYGIFTLDPEGYVRTWNSSAERIKGYEDDEIVGEHVSTFYTEEDREAGVPERNLETAAEDGSVTDEGWRVKADGSRFWANVTITAIRDEDGQIEGYAKVARDMTERREQERQLRRERDLIDRILETTPVRFAIFDADGSMTRLNSASRRQFGLGDVDPAEVSLDDLPLSEADGTPLDPDDHPLSVVLDTGDAVTDRIVTHPDPTGETRWVSLMATPLFDDDGSLERVVVTGNDITELQRTQQQLERQRDDLEHELQDVFDRVSDAFYALDDAFRFTYVNDRAEEMLGHTECELVGRSVWEALSVPEDAPVREQFERALAEQEPTKVERFSEAAEGWVEVRLYPSESGLSVYFKDITERKRHEDELQLYETIVETMQDGVYVLDEDFEFVRVNEAYAEMTGYDQAELVGAHCSLVVDPSVSEESVALMRDIAEGTVDGGATLEADINRADGTRLRAESNFTTLAREDTDRHWKVGVVRDVSEREERERELQRYEAIVETMDDGVYVIDDDDRFTMVNRAYAELLGRSREALLGTPAATVIRDETVARAAELHAEMAAGVRDTARMHPELTTADGDTFVAEVTLALLESEAAGHERVGVVRDVTEREERERELRRRVEQQEVVTELGQRALEQRDPDALMEEAVTRVSETLDTDYCKVLDLDRAAGELLLRQGVGWADGIVGTAAVSAVDDDSQAAYTLSSAGPVVVEDLATEPRFSGPDLLRDHDVTSGISTIIGTLDEPWGVLGTHDTGRREFSTHDINFVQSVANILATAISRHADERELRRQREQLSALDDHNRLVREITRAVLDQSSRAEIESTVCTYLADTEPYRFAWIGDVDAASQTVSLRTEAGVEGYLDDATISVDPDDERSSGPTGMALRTGEVQTVRDVRTDEKYGPWRDHYDEYAYRSSAAIPITHEGTTYGVLNVYAARPNAFEGAVGTVIASLGEVIGHAIAATERKRALMSDEVVELEFAIRGVFDAMGVGETTQGTITLDHTVHVEDDDFLVYGTATADAHDSLYALADSVPHWADVTIREADGEVATFELRLSEPPVLSVVASVGGVVETAVIDDGDYRMTIHVAPGTNVRELTDTVQKNYPSAELLTRRQISRDDETPSRIRDVLSTGLTDRQRVVLRAAYHAGFFEWPRDVTGEAVADSLGISAPTFHQHLRKAERKVLDSLLGERSTAP